MRRLYTCLNKHLKLKIDPIEIKISDTNSNNSSHIHKYISFMSGSLLVVSESLPYFDNINGNGILHVFENIQKEYRDNFNK